MRHDPITPAAPGEAGRLRRALALVWRDPSLRMVAAGVLLQGAFAASLGVHQSRVAVDLFGLTDAGYAGVLLLATAASVAGSIGLGILADRGPHRRATALVAAGALVAGGLLVALGRNAASFVLASTVLLPIGTTLFGQLFAAARLASAAHAPEDRPGILSVLRALFAVPFTTVLPVWGFALAEDVPLLAIYPATAAIGAALLLLILLAWPRDAEAPWEDRKSGLSFRDSLREMASAPLLVRVALMGAVHVGGFVGGIILALLFARAGRGEGDAALFFGLFVVVEIAGTLALGALAARAAPLTLMAAGTALYAAFLVLLPALAPGPFVWLLALPAGLGGALIYTLAIAYLQGLLAERPGAGGSLLAVQRVTTEGLATGAFLLGTAAQGYAAASVLGALVPLAAALALLRLDAPHGGSQIGPQASKNPGPAA